MAVRLAHNPKLPDDVRERYASTVRKVGGKWEWSGEVALFPERLEEPLKRRKSTRYFVPSMGDLFHDDVRPEFIHKVFEIMEKAKGHTFQVLTKRPKRMKWFLDVYASFRSWPLPNVWLGTSIENQAAADERIPLLLQTPAAARFVSCEPLLGAVDLTELLAQLDEPTAINALTGKWCDCCGPYDDNKLDWVIVGGESGPGARPMHPDWARGLRDQCQEIGIPFHFKQWGAWWPDDQGCGSFLDDTEVSAST